MRCFDLSDLVSRGPLIIAEMSGNHNQSIQRGFEIIKAAAAAGAKAVKIQTYTADTITLNVKGGDFEINDPNSLWSGKNLHDLYKQAHTPWEWHKPLFDLARSLGIICFSTPFDESAVEFLEAIDVPMYKIASFENNHLPLIKKVALTKKPIIMSTGMATLGELEEAVQTARDNGCKELVLLKCTSTYPASPSNSNILTIPHLKRLFRCEVGLSDHTLGIGVSVAAVALGATVIEKHFTLSRAEGGVDSAFSLEPIEFASLVEESQKAWEALGEVSYGPTEAEKKSLVFRRSIYVSSEIKSGQPFTEKNIRIVRPGKGLAPKYFNLLLGKKAKMDLHPGQPISWECF